MFISLTLTPSYGFIGRNHLFSVFEKNQPMLLWLGNVGKWNKKSLAYKQETTKKVIEWIFSHHNRTYCFYVLLYVFVWPRTLFFYCFSIVVFLFQASQHTSTSTMILRKCLVAMLLIAGVSLFFTTTNYYQLTTTT